jgi:hypothetical protein
VLTRLLHIGLVVSAATAFVAVPVAGGAQRSYPGIPSIYVTYNEDCTFSMTADGGFTFTSSSPPGPTLPPGVYQIEVLIPNPSQGYPCGAPEFTLTGPGVDSVTPFPYAATFDDHVLPALKPSSTYVAQDQNAPVATRVYFTTSATGSSSSLLGKTPGQTTSGKGTTEPDIVGSSVAPYRGRLAATVGAAGATTLKLGGREVASLRAGRYDVAVVDSASHAGFLVRKAGHGAVTLTTPGFVGKKTVRLTLTAGQWTYSAGTGRPTASFKVVA